MSDYKMHLVDDHSIGVDDIGLPAIMISGGVATCNALFDDFFHEISGDLLSWLSECQCVTHRESFGDFHVEAVSIYRDDEVSLFVVLDRTDETLEVESALIEANADDLTGLPSRNQWMNFVRDEIQSGIDEFSILYIDLDQFKPVNDTYGHSVGDMVLRVIADRLSFSIRESEMVTRLGGDEFAVFIRSGKQADVSAIKDRLVDTIARTIHFDGNDVRVSCSIGISLYPDDGDDITTLLDCADRRMYLEKK